VSSSPATPALLLPARTMIIANLPQVDPFYYFTIFTSFIVCQLAFGFAGYLLKKHKDVQNLSLLDQIDLFSRVPGMIHCLIVFFICAYVHWFDYFGEKTLFNNPVFGVNHTLMFSLAIGVGYFLSDLIIIVRYNIPPTLPLVCHHLFAGWGFMVILVSRNYLWFASYLYLTEGANPWYNLWWVATKLEHVFDKRTSRFIALSFVYSWIVFRLFPNAYIFHHFFYHFEQVYSVETEVFLVLVLNMVFLFGFNYYYFMTGPFFGILAGEYMQNSFGVFTPFNPKFESEKRPSLASSSTLIRTLEEEQTIKSMDPRREKEDKK